VKPERVAEESEENHLRQDERGHRDEVGQDVRPLRLAAHATEVGHLVAHRDRVDEARAHAAEEQEHQKEVAEEADRSRVQVLQRGLRVKHLLPVPQEKVGRGRRERKEHDRGVDDDLTSAVATHVVGEGPVDDYERLGGQASQEKHNGTERSQRQQIGCFAFSLVRAVPLARFGRVCDQ